MEVPSSITARTIERGNIYHSYYFQDSPAYRIDHGKFFVVVKVTDTHVVGFFFINSLVNVFVNDKPEQLALQYEISPKDYDFLDHTCYVSAAKIEPISLSDMVKSIEDGKTSYRGKIEEDLMNRILDDTRKSPLYSQREVRLYLS